MDTRWQLDLLVSREASCPCCRLRCQPSFRGCASEVPVPGVGFWGSRALAMLWEWSGSAGAVQRPQSPLRGRFLAGRCPGCRGAEVAPAARPGLPWVSFRTSPANPLPPPLWPAGRAELWPWWHCPFSALTPAAGEPSGPELPSLAAIPFLLCFLGCFPCCHRAELSCALGQGWPWLCW